MRTQVNKAKKLLIGIGLALLASVTACERAPAPAPNDEASNTRGIVSVRTVNYPLQYFAQRIGGQQVDVVYPGPVNADPAYWNPDVDKVVGYQQADLILLNGAGYAGWVKKVSLPLATQVDTSAGFRESLLPESDKVAHTHGPTGEHVHDDLAFTVWLDPQLAEQQAIAITEALTTRIPDRADKFKSNFDKLQSDLQQLDADAKKIFAARSDTQFIYSHPVYQYFDSRYELDGFSLHWEPGELPDNNSFEALGEIQDAIMLWEAEPLSETREKLAAIGITSVVFDPCATTPQSGDYLDVMRANLQRLESALP